MPRRPLSIVAIGDQGEALLLRAILENLGAAVRLHLPGTPEDFLRVIGQGESAPPILIISGHGNEKGFIFGEFAPEIDVSMLSDGHLGADAIAARAQLSGAAVISTACGTGAKGLAAAFLGGGASCYVAPEGYPDGADAVLFVHRLMHGVLRDGFPLAEAFARAQYAVDPENRFTIYSSEMARR